MKNLKQLSGNHCQDDQQPRNITNEIINDDDAVFSLIQSSKNTGELSLDWGRHLLTSINTSPLRTIDGVNLWLDAVWEGFYDWGCSHLSNNQQALSKFNSEGSPISMGVIWLNKHQSPSFLCIGNIFIFQYKKETDELLSPYPITDFAKWIDSNQRINWSDENTPEVFLGEGHGNLGEGDALIICNKAIAKHLIISYLIIKSKEDSYWNKLESIMRSDTKLANLFYQNKDAYDYDSFTEVIQSYNTALQSNFSSFIKFNYNNGQIDSLDCAISILSYQKNRKNWTKENKLNLYSVPLTNKLKNTRLLKTKSDAQKFMDVILEEQIFKLYHFTDLSNVESIKKRGGLLCWHYCEVYNLNIPLAGGDQLSRMLDRKYNLHDYVRCSFTRNHPMMHAAMKEGRLRKPVILEIDPRIITFESTKFSNMNATKTGHHRGSEFDDFNKIHFSTVKKKNHFDLSPQEKPYYQAEVMVQTFIPSKYILNLNDL